MLDKACANTWPLPWAPALQQGMWGRCFIFFWVPESRCTIRGDPGRGRPGWYLRKRVAVCDSFRPLSCLYPTLTSCSQEARIFINVIITKSTTLNACRLTRPFNWHLLSYTGAPSTTHRTQGHEGVSSVTSVASWALNISMSLSRQGLGYFL